MQRSGSQKVLLVLSILNIIGAVIMLLSGLLVMMGGTLFGAVNPVDAATALEGSGLTQGQASALAGVGGLLVIIAGIVELVLGILGVRAANDNQKIMPVWVLSIIQLVLCALSLISAITSGSFGSKGISAIISLIIAVLIMWIANNIKKEAGK